uniref:Uncharacterized protein n=1 Tax=Cucumis sativus TaxID=3659 RepID=A0A0A0KWM7_CUCSA
MAAFALFVYFLALCPFGFVSSSSLSRSSICPKESDFFLYGVRSQCPFSAVPSSPLQVLLSLFSVVFLFSCLNLTFWEAVDVCEAFFSWDSLVNWIVRRNVNGFSCVELLIVLYMMNIQVRVDEKVNRNDLEFFIQTLHSMLGRVRMDFDFNTTT